MIGIILITLYLLIGVITLLTHLELLPFWHSGIVDDPILCMIAILIMIIIVVILWPLAFIDIKEKKTR